MVFKGRLETAHVRNMPQTEVISVSANVRSLRLAFGRQGALRHRRSASTPMPAPERFLRAAIHQQGAVLHSFTHPQPTWPTPIPGVRSEAAVLFARCALTRVACRTSLNVFCGSADADNFEPDEPIKNAAAAALDRWEGEDEEEDVKVLRRPADCGVCGCSEQSVHKATLCRIKPSAYRRGW